MPIPTNATSSPSTFRKRKLRLDQSEGSTGSVAHGAVVNASLPDDSAAVRALAWIERGQSDAEIVFDESAPKQTPAELAQFKPASLRRKN